jgi:tRNA pseudouridine32 synthase/23S rRNA pseudouridine746 synthase
VQDDVKNGSSKSPFPSSLFLPELKNQNLTILTYLSQRFPQIGLEIWKERVLKGDVFFENGGLITPLTPYAPHRKICYHREVKTEPKIPSDEKIIFQNRHFIVACKPHYLPVIPTGKYVNNCLLYRLRKTTGLDDLVAVHRLDMETAGVILFSCLKESRALYNELFRLRAVRKHYEAIASLPRNKKQNYWSIENRIVRGEPWFISKIEQGSANAVSEIALVATKGEQGYYHLKPQTGKKHQLRVHLGLITRGIINDPLYPKITEKKKPLDFNKPLQLLAKQLDFVDPITGKMMSFHSVRRLEWSP